MATAPEQNKRHVAGPRGLGAVLPAVTRAAFRKRSPAAAGLMTDWPDIVGPAIAAVASPVRFTSGTLTIAASGPMVLELQYIAPELIARLNAYAGKVLVERLRFAAASAAPAAPVRMPPKAKPVAALAEDEETFADLPDGPVREALRGLRRALGQAGGR